MILIKKEIIINYKNISIKYKIFILLKSILFFLYFKINVHFCD